MALAQWPMPPWVALWVDPAMAETVRASVIWSLEAITALMPWILPLLEWIAPLLWVLWAVGIVGLVVVAGIGLFVIGRLRRRSRTVQYA